MYKTILKYLICLILVCSAFYFSKIVLFAISFLFIYLSCKEYRNIFKNKNIVIYKIFPEIMSMIFAFFFIFNKDFLDCSFMILLIISLFVPFGITILKNQKPYVETACNTFLLIFFVFCGLFTIKLYETQPILTVVIYFCSILLSDYSASIIGLKIKNRVPLAKEISPKKTTAGFFAHLITSTLIFTLAAKFMGLTLLQGTISGFLISGTAQFGDLTISCVKRDCGVKHSSDLFGEYGGILDRMDSFIFSAPTAYLLLTSICQLGV